MNKPRFSVVVPLYNKEKSIERTVSGVLAQTFPDFELVIVDDGSTDGSVDIVRSITDPRIRLVQQPNGGPSAARNTGVRHTKADWVVFLDADDELTPDALEHFDKMLKAHPEADIIDCAKQCRVGDRLIDVPHPIEGWVKNNMRECYFGHISPGAGFSVFRKAVLDRCPYDERLRRYEDAEWLLRILDGTRVYSSRKVTSIHDMNYAQASAPRKDIREDAMGYLSLKGKNFWAKMATFRLYLEERESYPADCHRLYPTWYWRYDLLLLHKLLNRIK